VVLIVSMISFAQGVVSKVPSLKDARQHHTATLLQDGRVLITGGRGIDGLSTLASCELYTPKSNTWTSCAPLLVARSHHAAVLLDDGRVLVTGGTTHESVDGNNRFVALASTEIYDPKKNVWVAGPSMADARNGHTAVRLKDGSVLVAGGAREQRTHLATVERFTPSTNTWAAEKPLSVGRWMHTAALTPDGDVVVAGGRSNTAQSGKGPGVSIASVERFDFKTREWVALPDMSEPRQRTSFISTPEGDLIVIGGQTATASTNYAETWRPGLTSWEPFQNHLSQSLNAHTGTRLPSGDLVVIGGEPPNSVDTTRVQRWKADTKEWCLAGELKVSRKTHSATLLQDGRVLVVGGTSGGLPEKTAELWVPAKGKCEEPPGISMGW